MIKSYKKGYRFELKVKKTLQKRGHIVFRQGKSSFPDLICLSRKNPKVKLVECKVRGKLDKEEIKKAKKLNRICPFYLAFPKNSRVMLMPLKNIL